MRRRRDLPNWFPDRDIARDSRNRQCRRSSSLFRAGAGSNGGRGANQRCRSHRHCDRGKRCAEYRNFFLGKIDAETLAGQIVSSFQKYLDDAGAEVIDLTHSSVKDIVQRYLNASPPFGRADKKVEFPDAIVLSALEGWCREHGNEVYVVSRDKEFRAACDAASDLYPLEDVPEFLDLISRHEGVASERLLKVFALEATRIKGDVKIEFERLGLYLTEYDGDAEIESVDDVDLDDPNVISIDETTSTLELECRVDFTAAVSYEDPDSGMWDSEDKVMLFVETISKSVHETEWVTVEICARYPSLTSLADPESVKLIVVGVNHGSPLKIRLD